MRWAALGSGLLLLLACSVFEDDDGFECCPAPKRGGAVPFVCPPPGSGPAVSVITTLTPEAADCDHVIKQRGQA